jgi:hypothetical protein
MVGDSGGNIYPNVSFCVCTALLLRIMAAILPPSSPSPLVHLPSSSTQLLRLGVLCVCVCVCVLLPPFARG